MARCRLLSEQTVVFAEIFEDIHVYAARSADTKNGFVLFYVLIKSIFIQIVALVSFHIASCYALVRLNVFNLRSLLPPRTI